MKPFIETAALFLFALFIGYGLYWFATFNLPTVPQMEVVLKAHDGLIPLYRMDGRVTDGKLNLEYTENK